MKKHSSFLEGIESGKEAKSMRRDSRTRDVGTALQLRKQLMQRELSCPERTRRVCDGERPNLDRLTVGVDLGD